MKNLLTRTLTGAIFVLTIVTCTLWNHYSFSILFCIITTLGLHEFFTNLNKKKIAVQTLTGTIAGVLLFVLFACISIFQLSVSYISLVLPIFFLIFIIELYRKKENPFQNIAFTIIGILYISIPFALLNFLTNAQFAGYTSKLILSIFILTWTNDTFAYLSGITLGKHRLFERHSPKKSWEGFIGGVVFCIGMAFVLNSFLGLEYLNIFDWIVMALCISCIGTLGDLVESMFKRSLNIKDSGSLLPGHGGVLDRFDSILISVPFIFSYIVIAKEFFKL